MGMQRARDEGTSSLRLQTRLIVKPGRFSLLEKRRFFLNIFRKHENK